MWKSLLEKKIHTSFDTVSHTISIWQYFNEKIVFTNGCFDILHYGHLSYLMQAKEQGDRLVIGLNTDASVKKLKGEQRPIQVETARAMMLASLSFVDAIILFEEETPLNLITSILPDVLVKGGDYTVEQIAGAKEVIAHGGEVKIVPILEGFSTTGIIEKMKGSNS